MNSLFDARLRDCIVEWECVSPTYLEKVDRLKDAGRAMGYSDAETIKILKEKFLSEYDCLDETFDPEDDCIIDMHDEKDDMLVRYSRMLDEIAWFNNGDISELAKLAKQLNRNYTIDLAERKKQLLDSKH